MGRGRSVGLGRSRVGVKVLGEGWGGVYCGGRGQGAVRGRGSAGAWRGHNSPTSAGVWAGHPDSLKKLSARRGGHFAVRNLTNTALPGGQGRRQEWSGQDCPGGTEMRMACHLCGLPPHA